MQIRSVIKLGVVLSVVLFCIGIAFYGFARLSMADQMCVSLEALIHRNI